MSITLMVKPRLSVAYEEGKIILHDIFMKYKYPYNCAPWLLIDLSPLRVSDENIHTPFRNGKLFLRKKPWTEEERCTVPEGEIAE
jgi:hypothetical protein